VLENVKSWWNSRQRRPVDELLAVEFDDTEVRVRVLADVDDQWNQSFRWSNIIRVCFEAGGLLSSDVVYVSLNDREKPAQPRLAAAMNSSAQSATVAIFRSAYGAMRSAIRAGDCTAGHRRTIETRSSQPRTTFQCAQKG
jgi:hypothetical protein